MRGVWADKLGVRLSIKINDFESVWLGFFAFLEMLTVVGVEMGAFCGLALKVLICGG